MRVTQIGNHVRPSLELSENLDEAFHHLRLCQVLVTRDHSSDLSRSRTYMNKACIQVPPEEALIGISDVGVVA